VHARLSAKNLATADLVDDDYHNTIKKAAIEKCFTDPAAIYGRQYASWKVWWNPGSN